MSVSAYLFLGAEIDQVQNVAEAVRNLDGVDVVEVVTGPYDIIVRTSAPTMDELGQMVVSRVRQVPGIKACLSSPVLTTL